MKCFLINLFAFSSFLSYAQFGTEQVISLGYASDFVVEDIDNDGDNDILYTSRDTIKLLNNNGVGVFTKTNIHIYPLGTYSLDVIDLDNDNLKDIVFTMYLNKQVLFVKNLGNGNFSPTATNLIYDLDFTNIENIEVAKKNDTGYILISSTYDMKTRIYRGDTIVNLEKYPLGSYAYTDASKTHGFGFIDNDSLLDVLGNKKYFYRGKDVSAIFHAPIPLTSIPQNFIYTILSDVDNDLDLDYVYITTTNKIGYHKFSRPQNAFNTSPNTIDSTNVTAIKAGYNAFSNYPFIAGINYQTHKVSYFSNTNGVFSTENVVSNSFTRPTILDVGDIDQDGNDDIIAYSSENGNERISWFKNMGPTTQITENKKTSKVIIFPNPANNNITIVTDLMEFNIHILNSDGSIVLEKQKSTNKEINIEHFSKGVYFILLSSSNNSKEVFYQKLVKY